MHRFYIITEYSDIYYTDNEETAKKASECHQVLDNQTGKWLEWNNEWSCTENISEWKDE